MLLGEILVRKKLVSSTQLTQTIEKQVKKPRKIGELLIEEQLISSSELQTALKEQYWRRNGYWVIG